MQQGNCSSCGADIIWCRTEKGKSMPLDVKPQKRIVLEKARGRTAPIARVVPTYLSHFVTCPDAKEHRKR